MNPAPNLTQRPPRSPRVRLGGYVILARGLDKGRAELADTAGEYKYNNPMDRHWFRYTGTLYKIVLILFRPDLGGLPWHVRNRPPDIRQQTTVFEPSLNV